jgi:hypothetical protein
MKIVIGITGIIFLIFVLVGSFYGILEMLRMMEFSVFGVIVRRRLLV